MADREPVIGIDLGTTNSVVATIVDGQPLVVKSQDGANLTPSMVAITDGGRQLVGRAARGQEVTNPRQTVYASKRLIGRKFSSAEVQDAKRRLSYSVVCGEHDDVRVQLGGSALAVPELSAMILRTLKADAEAFFGTKVTKAVITVPAHFNATQRQATKDAGMLAGLDVLRIINEPTAAALAYGFGKSMSGKIAVFDLGGGTFDISVLELSDAVFEVIATGGDTYLGGEDFDNRVIDWLVAGFQKEHGVDLRADAGALQRVKDAAEKAKIDLSTYDATKISLPFIRPAAAGVPALHLEVTLTRDKLEELTGDLVVKTIAICDQVLREGNVKVLDLTAIILVGGMTRMPKVLEQAKQYFKREPATGVDPDEVVALGAAVHASALLATEAQSVLLDVVPFALGVAVAGGFVRRLIPKNTTVPTSVTEVFNTSRDNQTAVKILVLQGDSAIAAENELLGEFTLTGLRAAPRGAVAIEVVFEISSEGLVLVSGKDRETGIQQTIQVTPSGGLTHNELLDIMDKQIDYALEASSGGELIALREELAKLVKEAQALIPTVERISGKSGAGADTVTQARSLVEAAQTTIVKGELSAVSKAVEQLSRTIAMFRAVIQHAADTGGLV